MGDSKRSEFSEQKQEEIHFNRVLNSFKCYRKDALLQIARCEKSFKSLPQKHQDLLPDHLNILNEMRACVEQNHAICMEIVKTCGSTFENTEYHEDTSDVNGKNTRPRPMDMDKVRTTLKQIVRDWTTDGQSEREQCYTPIIAEIKSRLTPHYKNGEKKTPSVLVPGCGLGRLAWELAHLGFACEGNEFSFFMLFVSNYILNRTPHSSENEFHQFTIYPWVTQRCNVPSWRSILTPIKFPDINPASIPSDARFSMAAGDFLEVYDKEASWDCVATCYFIDTAHNIIAYIERIFHLLTPGGLWVNLGPLLYHYADMANEMSVEFSYEQVFEIIQKIGFQILKDERDLESTYVTNPASMLQYNYRCALLVAKKPSND